MRYAVRLVKLRLSTHTWGHGLSPKSSIQVQFLNGYA
jgi:hypothetical protein